jgi:23S rRNA (cytosine1962-C5)-methyltransferase
VLFRSETGPSALYLRTEKGIREIEGLAIEDGLLRGNPSSDSVTISENGLLFEVNFKTGHKTGFYLDQRDNRRRAAEFAAGKKCLDLFCYSGGFALNLAKAGAREVVGIDSSEAALALANGNAKLNGLSGVSFMKEDAERAMQSFLAQNIRFDLVVLDPPRFAQSSPGVRQALKAYARLNALAAGLLNPGGTLVTCSCSGRVTRRDFLSMLSAVSLETNRPLRVLEQRGAAPDHPVSVSCPESDYLKCFICRVE